MNDLTTETEPREVVPEIVGHDLPEPPRWRSFLNRALLAAVCAGLGTALLIAGLFLTISILGAPLGIPLALVGLFLILLGGFVLFARGRVRVAFFR